MNVDTSTNLSPVSVLDVGVLDVLKYDRNTKSKRTLPTSPPLAEEYSSTEKKSVCFSKIKRVKKIPHLRTLPDRVIRDCWFGPKDLESMKISNYRIVYLMDIGASDLVKESESTRGLENETQDGAWNLYQHRQYAYDAVLDEQERQWKKDIEDPYIVSRLYQEANEICTNIALAKAESDEKEIQDYLADTRIMCSNNSLCPDG